MTTSEDVAFEGVVENEQLTLDVSWSASCRASLRFGMVDYDVVAFLRGGVEKWL